MFRANLSAHERFLVERNVSHRRNRRLGVACHSLPNRAIMAATVQEAITFIVGRAHCANPGLPLLLLLSKEGGEGNENGLRGHARLLKP
jgi:hypothetical protein